MIQPWKTDDFGKLLNEPSPPKSIFLNDLLPGKTVFIVIDMLNGFVKAGALASPNALIITEKIARILRSSKERGIPAVFFADSHEKNSTEFLSYPEHCIRGSEESLPVQELSEIGGYVLIGKNSTNAFLEPAWQEWLSENPSVSNYIVTGCCTDICIEQFALTLKADFSRRNKVCRIIVPKAATSTYEAPNHPAGAAEAVAYQNLLQNGIEVVPDIIL